MTSQAQTILHIKRRLLRKPLSVELGQSHLKYDFNTQKITPHIFGDSTGEALDCGIGPNLCVPLHLTNLPPTSINSFASSQQMQGQQTTTAKGNTKID